MKQHYCTYEQSVALKRLGFDWDVRGYYTRDDNFQKVREITALNHNDTKKFKGLYSAPRFDQAAAWLRDCKGIDVEVSCIRYNLNKKDYKVCLCYFSNDLVEYKLVARGIHSYENALSIGIDKALELLGKEANNGM